MNAMVERFRRSWDLFCRSVQVIRDHPKLLIFPLISGLMTLGIVLFFLLPVALVVLAPHWTVGKPVQTALVPLGVLQVVEAPGNHGAGTNFQLGPVVSVFLAVMYLVGMFLAVFCNVAFTSQILAALSGDPVSLREGFGMACRRWTSILLWTLLAGLVGLLIRALEERFRFLGRLIAGLIGLAWSVASIFAIPILIRETATANPIKILTRSAETIKRTWGEAMIGYVGLQGANALFLWLSLLYWASSVFIAWLIANFWWLLPAGGAWLLGLFTYSYLAGVAGKVYLCALYVYASEGVVPAYYDAAMMDMAWKVKKS